MARQRAREADRPGHEECMRRLRAVSEAAVAITSELTLERVLQKIADSARDLVGAKYAALGVVDEEQRRLSSFVVSGITSEEAAAIGTRPRGLGLLGLLLQEPRPIRVRNIAEDPRSIGFPPHHPEMTSFLGVPIVSKGKVLGNFYMADKVDRGEFSQEDEDILALFAAHAAVAIENARLYTQTDTALKVKVAEVERSERQARFFAELGSLLLAAPLKEDLELQVIAERLTEPLGDAAGIYLIDEDDPNSLKKKAVYHSNPARGLAAEEVIESAWPLLKELVLLDRQAILVPLSGDREHRPGAFGEAIGNPRGFTGLVAVPISVRDRTFGVLLSLASQPLWLTDEDRRFASTVAGRLATKIENIQLFGELRSQRSLLRSILETMTHAVYVADPDGNLVCTNPAYARLIGAERMEPAERSIQGYARAINPRHADGRPISYDELPMSRSLRGETFTRMVVLMTPLDGRGDRYMGVSGAPILDEQGNITGAVNVARDITEEAELERLKDEFISVASHEMKSPVAAAKGYAQLLTRRLHAEPELTREIDLAGRLARQIDRLAELLEKLLDVSRVQTRRLGLHKEELDLGLLAVEVAQRMQVTLERHWIEVTFDAPALVSADRMRLEQVITNLLSNAVKYSPSGGQIDLAIHIAGDEARVTVQDHGLGIPEDKQPHVFERFFRAVEEGGGLGIGLYVCRGIVEAHGGRIWLESKEGSGSTFFFTLPLPGR